MADLENTNDSARSADTGSKLATLGQVKNVLDYSKNEITELKSDLDDLNKNNNLFNLYEFCHDGSDYYSYSGGYINVNSTDTRAESDIKYTIKLYANVEYVISCDYSSDVLATYQIYDSNQRIMAFNNVVRLHSTFTPSATGNYTIKILRSNSSIASIGNLFIGRFIDWISVIKDGIVPIFNSELGDAECINRAIIKASFSPVKTVLIPYKSTYYSLEKSIEILSGITLKTSIDTAFKLNDDVNKPMIVNAHRTTSVSISDFNIKIIGGEWLGNAENQSKLDSQDNLVVGFWFAGVKGLEIRDCHIYNPRTYGILINNISDVIVDNITIETGDVNNPDNADGFHILGPANNITLKNSILKSEDNVIAINANDVNHGIYSTQGNISNVVIDNILIKNDDGGQGMLILSSSYVIKNIKISNITGTARYFMQINHWNMTSSGGFYEDIIIDKVNFNWLKHDGLGFLYANGNIRNMKISDLTIYDNSPYGATDDDVIHIYKNTKDTSVNCLNVSNILLQRNGESSTSWSMVGIHDSRVYNLICEKLCSIGTKDDAYIVHAVGSTIDKLSITLSDIPSMSSAVESVGTVIGHQYIDNYTLGS